MRLTVNDPKGFKSALKDICMVVEKKVTMPVLAHFRLYSKDGRTYMVATDIETSIKADITKSVSVEDPGDILLPAKFLKDYMAKQKGSFQIITSSVKEPDEPGYDPFGKIGNMKIATLPSSEFPVWPNVELEPSGIEPYLKSKLDKVINATGIGDTRYALNSVYFDFQNSQIVGTDGHRLSLVKMNSNHNEGKIVPRKSADVLRTFKTDPDIKIGEDHILFDYGDTMVLSRVMDGVYPQVEKILPGSFETAFSANREAFINALEAVVIVSKDRGNAVVMYCKFTEQELVIYADSPDLGHAEEKIPCRWDGRKEINFGVNGKFVIEALKVLTGEDVVLCFNGALDPIKIVDPEDPNILHIIMPIRK